MVPETCLQLVGTPCMGCLSLQGRADQGCLAAGSSPAEHQRPHQDALLLWNRLPHPHQGAAVADPGGWLTMPLLPLCWMRQTWAASVWQPCDGAASIQHASPASATCITQQPLRHF